MHERRPARRTTANALSLFPEKNVTGTPRHGRARLESSETAEAFEGQGRDAPMG
jgi:hypothetical protein